MEPGDKLLLPWALSLILKADDILTVFVPLGVRIRDVLRSPAGQRGSWETNSFYQIEKLICEAKPMLPGAPGHGEARDPVVLDG